MRTCGIGPGIIRAVDSETGEDDINILLRSVLAICAEELSVVYLKLSAGINKLDVLPQRTALV